MSTSEPNDRPLELVADASRQAVSTLRGYAYQIWRTLHAWLRLRPGETLIVEGAEDFDVLHDELDTTVQVKDLTRNVTLASEDLAEAIFHYWEHRHRNPDRLIQFHFITTAGRGQERDTPFGDTRGLDYWDLCRRAGAELQPLRRFLAARRWPVAGRGEERALRERLAEELSTFIATASDEEFHSQLVHPIHWHTGSDTQEAIEQLVEEQAILHGAQYLQLSTHESVQAVSHLLRHVWAVACRREDRRLTFVDLLREFEQTTMVLVTRVQARQLEALPGTAERATLPVSRGALALGTPEDGATAPDGEEPWRTRLGEAREIQRAGAVRTSLRMLERLRDDALKSISSPRMRARIFNNIAAALMDLGRPDEAVDSLHRALEYAPGDATFLAHLAQSELVAGRKADARRHAEQAVALDPSQRVAWSVRIQTLGTPIAEEAIPTELRESPEILAARAMAVSDHDRNAAVGLLREALRKGTRDPRLLLLLAEMLYSALFPRRVSDPALEETVQEIARFAIEAADMLDGTEQARLFSRALVMHGAALDLAQEGDRGVALFERAVRADPTYARARFAAARAQMIQGRGDAALYLLDGIPEHERSADWHALRAASFLAADRPEEMDHDVMAALANVDPAEVTAVMSTLGEVVLRGDRLDLIQPIIERLELAEQWDFVHLFRARLAVRKGDRDTAEREYTAAIETGVPAARSDLQMEFAAYLHGEKAHDRAAALFEASGSWTRNVPAAQLFAQSLLILGRWDRAMALVEDLRSCGDLPAWAVDLDSRIALGRDDLPKAVVALERLVHRHPEDADARIRLAHSLIRVGREAEAGEVLGPIEGRDDLDAVDMVNLAQLLVGVGRAGRALELAYRALREHPDNPDLQAACILRVFLQAADEAPAELFVRNAVGPDTWMRLQAVDGEEVEYLVLSQGPHDVRRNEVLADDRRAVAFLGLRQGDSVTLREGAANEKTFRVMELKSALLHTFHDAMLGYQVRFPGRTDMQMVHVGEGDSFNPWPVYRMLLRANQTGHDLVDLYRDKRLPVGAIAEIRGQSVRRTYLQLLYNDEVPVYVEEPPTERLEESLAEARKPAAVLTATGLSTLQVLDHLELLPQMYERLLVPQSLVDELNEEIDRWDFTARHGGHAVGGVADDYTLMFTEVSPSDIQAVQRDLEQLRDAVLAMAEVAPRPLTPRESRQEEARELIGASSYDAYTLAGEKVGLHADDWGLRRLSRYETGVVGFSTYAMLRVAHERSLISEPVLHGSVTRLVGFGHRFIPVDAKLLYNALAAGGYQLDRPVLGLLDRLADTEATLESAAGVAVGLIRKVATSPLGKGAIGSVTAVVLERLLAGRDRRQTAQLFLNGVDRTLHLLPRERAVVHDRVRALIAAKTFDH